MKIQSCTNCGVLVDTDRLFFPNNIYKDDGEIDDSIAEWDGYNYVAYLPCPVCSTPILENQ